MIAVHFPEPSFRIRKEGGQHQIFDAIRRSWIVLTEEEWVRQNFIQYLVQCKSVPAAMVAVEKEILVNEMKKRFDLLVYDRAHHPWMMVECKAPEVKLDEQTLQQLLRYHQRIPVPFLVISNGHHTLAWEKTEGKLVALEDLPLYPGS